MVADEWKPFHDLLREGYDPNVESDRNRIKEMFDRIDQLLFEDGVMRNNQQLLITKIKLLETRVNLLEDQNPERLAIINKILFDILDELIFLQLADDVLKIEDRQCPKCNHALDDENYQKLKVDIDSLLASMKKIQTDLEKEIKKKT